MCSLEGIEIGAALFHQLKIAQPYRIKPTKIQITQKDIINDLTKKTKKQNTVKKKNISAFATINKRIINILQSKYNVLADEHNEEDKGNAQDSKKRNKGVMIKCKQHKPKVTLEVNKMSITAIDLEI